MSDIFSSKNNKLDDILQGLDSSTNPLKTITKTVSVRIPVLDIAKIDVLAELKQVSRNILLNEIIDAALEELVTKLEQKNPKLANLLESKAVALAEKAAKEPDHPPKPKGPKHKKEHH